MSQIISQSNYDLTENHFSGEIKTFLFLSGSETVPNAPSELLEIPILPFHGCSTKP
jgi:hypothetical protein